MKDVAERPFVLVPKDDGTGLHDAVVDLCRSAGFQPRVGQTVRGLQTLIGLVAAGFGVSVVPSSMRGLRQAGVVYRPIADEAARSDLYVASGSSGRCALAAEFVVMLHEAVAARSGIAGR